ncbi:MAG: hypothetical protein MI923_26080 [Phycisphaerales bacterium]|nr:hypothetical protein [Phycisphaerales bacterium]
MRDEGTAGNPASSPGPDLDPSTEEIRTSTSEDCAAFQHDIFCEHCAYNLRGLVSRRCPECGADTRLLRESQSQIPWVYRHKTGRLRAYWKTVWLVGRHGERFCSDIARPVDISHAKRFRLVTILHVYIPILIATILYLGGLNRLDPEFVLYAALSLLCVLLFLLFVTAVPHYSLRHPDLPTETQQRAAILCWYTCAPLACILPIAVLTGAVAAAGSFAHEMNWLGSKMEDFVVALLSVFGIFIVVIPVIMMWKTLFVVKRLIRLPKAVRSNRIRIILLWLATTLMTLGIIPFGVTFLVIVYFSLT